MLFLKNIVSNNIVSKNNLYCNALLDFIKNV